MHRQRPVFCPPSGKPYFGPTFAQLSGIKLKSMQPMEMPSCGSSIWESVHPRVAVAKENKWVVQEECTYQNGLTTGPHGMGRLWVASQVAEALEYFPRLRTVRCPDALHLPT
jgi:hypothetical protein